MLVPLGRPEVVGVDWSTPPGVQSSSMAVFRLVDDGRVQFHPLASSTEGQCDDSPEELGWGWLWRRVHAHRRNPEL